MKRNLFVNWNGILTFLGIDLVEISKKSSYSLKKEWYWMTLIGSYVNVCD